MNNNINDKLACSTLELVEKSIEELNKKSTLTPAELESLKKAYELRMEIQDCYGVDEMSDMGSYNSYGYNMGPNSYGHFNMRGSYDPQMSMMRGRSPVTGRYISRDPMMHDDMMMDNRSGHSIKDRMVARLEAMYDEAKSEHERDEIRKEIRRIESER